MLSVPKLRQRLDRLSPTRLRKAFSYDPRKPVRPIAWRRDLLASIPSAERLMAA